MNWPEQDTEPHSVKWKGVIYYIYQQYDKYLGGKNQAASGGIHGRTAVSV